MTEDDLIGTILDREGEAFTMHPLDRGGATKWGVTFTTFQSWRGRPQKLDDLRALTKSEAADIYRQLYLKPYAWIPHEGLRCAVVDYSVTSGTYAATRALQRAAGVDPDGISGAKTKTAVSSQPGGLLLKAFTAERVRSYSDLVDHDPSQLTWFHGWVRRAVACLEG